MSDAGDIEVIVHPLDDGSYWAEVDGLPGCLTQGNSYGQILAHLRDAHEACCSALDSPLTGEAIAAADSSALRKIITTGDLAQFLTNSGWQVVTTGSFHSVYRASNRPECISVLLEAEIPLVPALLAALMKFLN